MNEYALVDWPGRHRSLLRRSSWDGIDGASFGRSVFVPVGDGTASTVELGIPKVFPSDPIGDDEPGCCRDQQW